MPPAVEKWMTLLSTSHNDVVDLYRLHACVDSSIHLESAVHPHPLTGMNNSFTKNPMNPMMQNPIAQAAAIFLNSAKKLAQHEFPLTWLPCPISPPAMMCTPSLSACLSHQV